MNAVPHIDHPPERQGLYRPVSAATRSLKIWRASLHLSRCEHDIYLRFLSPCERHRAERFRQHRDRLHYIASHGILRAVLAQQIGRHPSELVFTTGKFGKPMIEQSSGEDRCWFSLARSGSLLLVAVDHTGPIGVDVERISADDTLELERAVCTRREQLALASHRSPYRQELFFSLWTRKEAVLKGWGTGLRTPPSSVDVLMPSERFGSRARGLENDEQSVTVTGLDGKPWEIQQIPLGRGYAAAVAASNALGPINLHDWSSRREKAHEGTATHQTESPHGTIRP